MKKYQKQSINWEYLERKDKEFKAKLMKQLTSKQLKDIVDAIKLKFTFFPEYKLIESGNTGQRTFSGSSEMIDDIERKTGVKKEINADGTYTITIKIKE